MSRIALVIATIFVAAAFGCGGRESGTGLGETSGTSSSGTSSGASGGAGAGAASGGSGSATTGSAANGGGQCKIVDPSNYIQSCSFDTDCVLVPGGITSCPPCACGEATVNSRVQAQYKEDRALALAVAGPGGCFCPNLTLLGPAMVPTCHQGTCRLEPSVPDATTVVPADASVGPSTGTQACNDETGATDCCPPDAVSGAACAAPPTCWSRCSFAPTGNPQGWRSAKYCTGGTWNSGMGLFPCYRSDAGTASADDAASGPACPSSAPQAASPCNGPIDCAYPGSCGSVMWTCSANKSYWAISQRPTCNGACPVAEPKQGDPCMAPGKCSYTSSCGTQDIVFCNGTGVVTQIDFGPCPKCPDQEPAPLTPCPGSLSCMYTNACAGTDVANCSGSTWTVLRGDCEK